jgi:hypothetical protein
MTETTDTALPPLEVKDERFKLRQYGGTEVLEVAQDVDGDLVFHTSHDGTVAMIHAADVPRFIDALCRLTGYDPRREALEEAAKIADELRHPNYSSETDDWVRGTSDAARAIRALAESGE